MIVAIAMILVIGLPLLLLITGSGSEESSKFKSRYPLSSELLRKAREAEEAKKKEEQNG